MEVFNIGSRRRARFEPTNDGKETTVRSKHTRWIVGALVSIVAAGSTAAAQHESQQPQTLLDVVREATAPFVDPEAAITAGYVPKTFCISGPNQGAMGVHFVNASIMRGASAPRLRGPLRASAITDL
jgi:hypothetical protein